MNRINVSTGGVVLIDQAFCCSNRCSLACVVSSAHAFLARLVERVRELDGQEETRQSEWSKLECEHLRLCERARHEAEGRRKTRLALEREVQQLGAFF